MHAGIQLSTAPVRGALVGVALGVATLALAAGVLVTHSAVAQGRTESAPAAVSVVNTRSNGATQQSGHGNLSGGESDGSSIPTSGHGYLP